MSDTPTPQCWHGHTTRQVGCVSCVLVFDRPSAPPASARTVTRYMVVECRRVLALAELLLSKGGMDLDACNDIKGLIGNYSERAVPESEIAAILTALEQAEQQIAALKEQING